MDSLKSLILPTLAALMLQQMGTNGMEIAAVGRVAQLGEFYDGTEEKFLNQLMFSKKLPPELNLVNTVDTPSTETKFQTVSNLREKIDFLDIAASMAVSLKCGGATFEASGSASYINQEKRSAKFMEGFLVHKTKTVKETVDLFYDGIRPYVDVMGVMETTASHVVSGIYYGADVAVKFTDTNQLSEDLQEIKGKMEVQFQIYNIEVKGSAELNITDGDYSNSSTYDLQISGDIPMNTIPRNAYEVVEFIKNVSMLMEEINDGKGKPILYILTPLSELQDAYQLDYMNAKIIQSIDDGVLNQILEVFQEISEARQRLNDLQEIFDIYTETCMTPPLKKSLDQLSNDFDTRAGEFTSEIRNGLIGVRSGNASFNLQHIIGNYIQHNHSFEKVNERLDYDYDDGLRKIQFYEAFKEQEIDYLTESAYEADLINTNHSIFYVLFYNLTLIDNDAVAWDDATNLFLTHLKRDWTKLKVVDCDFPLGNSHCSHLTKPVIHGFVKNRKVSSDVVKDYFLYNRSTPIRLPAMQNKNPFEPEKLYEIGQMFDWNKGQFLDSFLLYQDNVAESERNQAEPLQNLRCEIVPSTWKDTFRALSVPPMLQVPILLNQVGLLGSGQVFTYEKKPEVDRLHLVCEKQSLKHFANVDDDKVVTKSLDLLALIDNTDGSHFVQAVEYAAISIVSLEMEKSSNSTEEIRGVLELLKEELESQDEGGNGIKKDSTNFDLQEYKVCIFSDIFPQSQSVAKTVNEVKNVFQGIHDIFAEDVTKGTAVYTLHPTTNIQLEYGIISEPRSINPSVTFSGILEFAGMFDKIPSLLKKIDDQKAQFQKYLECMSVPNQEEILNLTNSFEGNLEAWYDHLGVSFNRFYDTGETGDLEAALNIFNQTYTDGESLLKSFTRVFEESNDVIAFYEEWRNITDGYVSSRKLWRESFYKSVEARAYFLVYYEHWLPTSNESMWKENLELFMDMSTSKNSTYKIFLLDCSFFADDFIACGNVSRPVIHEYKDGHLFSDDYLEKVKAGEQELTELEKLDLDIQNHKKDSDIKYRDCFDKFTDLFYQIGNFTDGVDVALTELRSNISSGAGIPPLGFVYNQFPNFADPTELWASTEWVVVTQTGIKGTLKKRIA